MHVHGVSLAIGVHSLLPTFACVTSTGTLKAAKAGIKRPTCIVCFLPLRPLVVHALAALSVHVDVTHLCVLGPFF